MLKVRKKEKESFELTNSKFVRSIVIKTMPIFIFLMIIMITITFVSFSIDIRSNFISEKNEQLESIESIISMRMDEVYDVCSQIQKDNMFLLDPQVDDSTSIQKTDTLARYTAGNDFIEHLAFYRVAEEDTIYVSKKERSLSDFFSSDLGLSKEETQMTIKAIKNTKEITIKHVPFFSENESNTFFSYTFPLPQQSSNPQGFILILITFDKVNMVFNQQISNCKGQILIYDKNDELLYNKNNLPKDKRTISKLSDWKNLESNTIFIENGKEYIFQKKVSKTNSWTYVSVLQLNEISNGKSNQMLILIIMAFFFTLALLVTYLVIIRQFKPISKLAKTLGETGNIDPSQEKKIIDEQQLLAKTIATIKDDREQKNRFEEKYIEANEQNKAKSIFFSNMSHDIRTPMNAIVGMTEIAMNHIDDTDYVRMCLQKVQVSSKYLLDIINNVLDMSRIESGKFVISEDYIELPKFIYSIETILNESLQAKKQDLDISIVNVVNERLIGDNVRLTQVFMNILSNSVKFTLEGGKIKLTIIENKCDEEGYASFTFKFSDNGIGMSKDFISKVFDTFSRDESSSISKIEGTGLGMAISKSFIELMGGDISCESELGLGTTFTINIKMKKAPQPESKEIDYSKYHILFVGELEDAQKDLLINIGINLDTIKNDFDDDDLEVIKKKNRYDFIIIKQTEKDIDGLISLSKVKKYLDVKNCRIYLEAKDLFSIDESQVYNSGIYTIIQSPLFRSTMINLINNKVMKERLNYKKEEINLDNLNILLVEDNYVNMQIAHVMISETKANVVEAYNGEQAVDIFKKSEEGYFDIILMDLQMPVMNGFEATSAIRNMKRSDAKEILIYALTANTFDEDVRQVKEYGMNGHIGKPYSSSELFAILKKAVKENK